MPLRQLLVSDGQAAPAASKVRIELFAVPSVKIKKDNPQANALWVVFVLFRFPQSGWNTSGNSVAPACILNRFNSRSAGKIHRQKQRRIRLPDLVHLCQNAFLVFYSIAQMPVLVYILPKTPLILL